MSANLIFLLQGSGVASGVYFDTYFWNPQTLVFVYRDLGIINARIVGPIGYENISHPLVMFGMDQL